MNEGLTRIVQDCLSKNNLTPELAYQESLVDDLKQQKKYYLSKCKGNNNKTYFFKFLINDSKTYQKQFKLEVQALAFLGKIDFASFATPVLKEYSLVEHAWYVREYIEGDVLGDAHLVESTPTLIEYHQQIMNILEELAGQKTTFDSAAIDSRAYYRAKIDQLGDFLNDIFPNFKKKLIEKLGQLKDIESPKCLVHGDFHYGNIFFVRDQKPYLTDWEFIHDGYIGEDIAQYVAIMWQHPMLQAEVLDNFRKKFNLAPEESPSFSFFQLYQNIKECQHWYYYYKYSENMDKYPRDYIEKALKYFKNKIHQQLGE